VLELARLEKLPATPLLSGAPSILMVVTAVTVGSAEYVNDQNEHGIPLFAELGRLSKGAVCPVAVKVAENEQSGTTLLWV
jgi:hypothetical protein